MRKRLIGGFVAVIGCAGLLAACGGGEETTAPTLNKAEFIAQGDEICRNGDKEIEAGAEEFAKENEVDTENVTTDQQEEAIKEVVVPSLRKQAEEIGELGVPEGEEEKVEALLTSLEDAADEIEADPGVVLEGSTDPLAEARQLANDFGFVSCGQ